jgi:hypothetical protein
MNHKKNIQIITLLVMLLTQPISYLSAQKKCAEDIIKDMSLPGDAPLHGTEKFDWGLGNAGIEKIPIPAKNYKGEAWTAMTNWGQVYIPRSGSNATNTRCQIRNVRTMILSKDGKWKTMQNGNPGGAAFKEDFANDFSKAANVRDEQENGGGVSVIVGVGDYAGFNFHFWTAKPARVDIDTSTIVGIYTSCEARLIIDDPKKPDDRKDCKNILMMGADWWLNKETGWKPDWSANSGIAGGRSKWVTTEWQTYNMCTLSPDETRKNPPCTF